VVRWPWVTVDAVQSPRRQRVTAPAQGPRLGSLKCAVVGRTPASSLNAISIIYDAVSKKEVAALQLFRSPKLRHPWPQLGTLTEKVGAMSGGGQQWPTTR